MNSQTETVLSPSDSRLSSWPRRLRWLVLAALLLSPPVLWWTSSHFRLVVYELAYPHLSSENQKRAFERIRNGEGRPDVAWRCYAEAAADPGQAWAEVFAACSQRGAFELRGLEDEVVRVLGDPRLYPAHETLFQALIACQVKDPRLPPLLLPYLEHRDLKVHAACALAINGRHERALPVLLAVLDRRPEVRPLSLGSTIPDIPEDAALALATLGKLGPAARPILPAIRPWAELEGPRAAHHAQAALWAIEGERQHLERLKTSFKALLEVPEDRSFLAGFPQLVVAVTLADLGEGDEAVRQLIERFHRRFMADNPILIEALGHLGAVGAPSLPLLENAFDHPDPALRDAARRAIDAIENDRRGEAWP